LAQGEVEIILLKQLASCLRIPISLLGRDGSVLYFNEPAESIFGRRFEESGGLGIEEWGMLLQPSDASGSPLKDEERPVIIALEDRVPAHRTIFIKSEGGRVRELEVTGLPLVGINDELIGALSLFWDPRESRPSTDSPVAPGGQQAVETILTRRVASLLSAPVFLVDAEGRLLYFNAGAGEILGHPFDDMLRESRTLLYKAFEPRDEEGNPIDPADHPLSIARLEQRPVHRRSWIRGLDGHDRRIAVTAIPLIGQSHRLEGAFGVFWEIEAS
jgi:PAS domain-containing protein